MQAFHNDPAIKAKYQARLAEHRRLGQLAQGIGFVIAGGLIKGCAVGCTLDNYDHTRYPIELGLPEWLAHLEDCIFEGLPAGDAEQFAEDFLEAIPVGADASDVRRKLAILRQQGNLARLEGVAEPYAEECRMAIRRVIQWHEAGEPESERSAVAAAAKAGERSAESAGERSAELVAESAAWALATVATVARSAELATVATAADSTESAWSAGVAARSAAWSAWSTRTGAAQSAAAGRSTAWPTGTGAAWSATWLAAKVAHYKWEAATLLQLLRECK